jgi:predicted GNAT superfamily acetyltransferase
VPDERTPHVLFIAESTTPCDLFDSVAGFLKGAPRGVDPDGFHRASRGAFARLGVAACEVAGTHAGTLSEAFHAKIGGQILGDPAF